jgi:DNA-binding winged helix-turn-helix (wHTH) protein/pimeloyl-ACP methyl ester carboxylesterase
MLAMAFLFGDHELDLRTFELRARGVVQSIEPQVFDLLACLVENRDRVVTKEELLARVWGDRIVSESALTTRLKEARRAIGDDGTRQALIRTAHGRGYRFVGEVRDDGEPQRRVVPQARHEDQVVDYCTADDGAVLAYATIGSGPALVQALSRLCHLERDWEAPLWRQWIDAMAPGRRLVRYDERGGGMSQWDVEDVHVERLVRDLEVVVDAAGLERFSLFGLSYTAQVPIIYAARHPERVERLVICGCPAVAPFAQAGNHAELSSSSDIIDLGFGNGSSRQRRLLAMQLMPAGPMETWDGFGPDAQPTMPTGSLRRWLENCVSVDLSTVLPTITVPTLVFHARDDQIVPFHQGRLLASLVPGSRFVELDSPNHLLVPTEAAWAVFLDELDRFLATASGE